LRLAGLVCRRVIASDELRHGLAGALMPLRESEAIVLQHYALGEADWLVSFLTRTMGRVRGVAAGARRPKSRFGSTLERLSYVRIWFFERENRELVRINQCEMIESFIDVSRDYGSSLALAIFSEVTEAVLPEHEASDASFRLLLLAARTVKKTLRPEWPLAYFALWSVKLGGWLAPLDRCGRCARVLQEGATAYFSRGGSVIACARCRAPGMRAVSPSARALAQRMLAERLDRFVENLAGTTSSSARELTDRMLDVIEHQIDRKLKSRELLEQTA
jgi:DNA repair protein RecO (recombination protein O)